MTLDGGRARSRGLWLSTLLGTAAVTALAALVMGCGGNRGPTTTIVNVGVAVSFDRDVDPLPFDPRGERLRSASAQLTGLAGHVIAFRFDTALLPEYRSSFEDALISAVENAAHDVRYLKEHQPEVFTRGVALLGRIECSYDAAASEDDAEFDAAERTLRVKVHPHGYSLLSEGLLGRALDDENDVFLERRFGALAPRDVPVAEQARYFHFLKGYRPHGPRRGDLHKLEAYASDPEALEILSVVELFGLAKDASLKAEIRKSLVGRGDYFTSAYVHDPGLVTKAAPNSAFHRAEAAWVNWLMPTLPSMTDGERLIIAKTVFVKMFNDDRERYGTYSSFAFPGFDPFAFALGIVDEWRKSGYPLETPEAPERGQLYEFIVCPHPVDERGSRSRGPRCDYDLYEMALASESGRNKLAEALLRRRDAQFTEMAVVNVGMHGGVDRTIELWRALEADEGTWRVATRVIADELAETSNDPLLDETRRLWRAYPDRRGAILYVLAQMDRYGNGKVPWSEMPRTFGAPIGEQDFAAFLDSGVRAMSVSPVVWPALGAGWSRALVIAPRLERYLDDPLVRQYNFQDPWLALRGIVNRLCAEHRLPDIAMLHTRFADRAQKKPSEARAWANLVEDTGAGACK
jgi:hypothetical protein